MQQLLLLKKSKFNPVNPVDPVDHVDPVNSVNSVNPIDITDDFVDVDLNNDNIQKTYYSTKDYVDFLNDKLKTINDKTYSEIISYTENELEDDHRYIQWIFPTTTPSSCATHIPIINISELQTYINSDPTIIDKLLKSCNMMMKHWGLKLDEFDELNQSNQSNQSNQLNIQKLNGHDALRLSRMLQSLVYHNQKAIATKTYDILSQQIGNINSVLNPLMYCGTCLDNMLPIGYLHNLHNIKMPKLYKNSKCIDVWRYHLLKAYDEFDESIKSVKN